MNVRSNTILLVTVRPQASCESNALVKDSKDGNEPALCTLRLRTCCANAIDLAKDKAQSNPPDDM